MEEVELLCNRVAIIDEGRIIALDTIRNLIAMLGGGVIYLGLPRADADTVTQIGALPAVREVVLAELTDLGEAESAATREDGAIIKVVAEQSQQALVNVISWLSAQDTALTSLRILEPNLESVFLHLTGKKLRE